MPERSPLWARLLGRTRVVPQRWINALLPGGWYVFYRGVPLEQQLPFGPYKTEEEASNVALYLNQNEAPPQTGRWRTG